MTTVGKPNHRWCLCRSSRALRESLRPSDPVLPTATRMTCSSDFTASIRDHQAVEPATQDQHLPLAVTKRSFEKFMEAERRSRKVLSIRVRLARM